MKTYTHQELLELPTNNLHVYGNYSDRVLNYSRNAKVIIPMPTLGDILDLLPKSIRYGYHFTMTKREVCYASSIK